MDEVRIVTAAVAAFLAALSVFDYPERQQRHDELKARFTAASAAKDSFAMAEASRQGTELLPEDPVWNYNLACSLALSGRRGEALDALEKAIKYGYRDSAAIAGDKDFDSLLEDGRFEELLATADRLSKRPVLSGPLSAIPAEHFGGKAVVLGAHNLVWNLDARCYEAKIRLSPKPGAPNAGEIYFNRDGGHSTIDVSEFPGLVKVSLDAEGRERRADLDAPNMRFPYPVFGNCSRALVAGPAWRSLPRALMTFDPVRMGTMCDFYTSNQFWVFPAVEDCPPAGTNGDVFASVSPYWIATQGKSWSDKYYLKAALTASGAMKPDVKAAIVRDGLLAPTLQSLLRKSLKPVEDENGYLTAAAHPTAFPPDGLDMARLKKHASSLSADEVPPLATMRGLAGILPPPEGAEGAPGEITYATPFATAVVLRYGPAKREFAVAAEGGTEREFRIVHDERAAAAIERTGPNAARVRIDRSRMSPTNRVDVAVFAKSGKSGWGAPTFVSFAAIEPADGCYVDPVLAPAAQGAWKSAGKMPDKSAGTGAKKNAGKK